MARKIFLAAALVFLVLVVYAKTISYPFIARDDGSNIYENPSLAYSPRASIPYFWKNSYHGFYIPVTMSSWSVIDRLSRTSLNFEVSDTPLVSPDLFHFSNVALHLASSLVVLLLTHLLLNRKSYTAAALGAAVFALHPLQVEAVAWASSMKDTLSTLGALSCILVYVLGSGCRPRVARAAYIVALVLFALALLSKPTPLAFVPVSLLAIDRLLLSLPWCRSLIRTAPFLIASIAIAITTYRIQSGLESFAPMVSPSLLQRPLIALDALGFYITKLFFPFSLGLDHGHNPARVLSSWWSAPYWLIVLAVGATGVHFFRKKGTSLYLIATAVTLTAILPVLGFVPFAYQEQSTVADRYMYLPMFGVMLGLATFLAGAGRRWHIAGAVVIVGLMVLSSVQANHWKSSERIFTKSLKVNPSSAPLAYNLGSVYLARERFDEALQQFETSMRLQRDAPLAYAGIGEIHLLQDDPATAIPYFERAIKIQPDLATTHRSLAICLHKQGDTDRATSHFLRAYEIIPNSEGALNLALAYAKQGNHADAETFFEKAIALAAGWNRPYSVAGAYYMQHSLYENAIRSLEGLVARNRNEPSSYALLAEAYARAGHPVEAVQQIQTAIELIKGNPVPPPNASQNSKPPSGATKPISLAERALLSSENPT